jgi:hypothetical protein
VSYLDDSEGPEAAGQSPPPADLGGVRRVPLANGRAAAPAQRPIVSSLRVVKYQRGDHELLRQLAAELPPHHALRWPEFVDYYFTGSPRCQLRVVLSEHGQVLGVLGVERMDFATPDRKMTLGFASNYAAFQPGVGALLFLCSFRDCDFGLSFGASEDAYRIYRGRNWTCYHGVRRFHVNRAFQFRPGSAPRWKQLVGHVLRHLLPKVDLVQRACRVLREDAAHVEVAEERRFSDDMLPKQSPFSFRFCPDLDHLNWRYNPELDFVRYRIFRILCSGQPAGYVVINEQPRRLLLAHCDGEDPLVLSQGILAAIAALLQGSRRRPEVFLTSSHTIMREVFRHFGLREIAGERPVFIGGRGTPPMPQDTSRWLVNFDWGDNGLQPPFLGRPSI